MKARAHAATGANTDRCALPDPVNRRTAVAFLSRAGNGQRSAIRTCGNGHHHRNWNDPARPWRLGRYYIRNAKTGHLAEAVVALSGKGLRATDTARVAQTVKVDQKDFQFTPETIAIRAGDRVRFLNNDAQVHNVQSVSSRHSFNVNMLSGSEHTETFPQAGGVRQPYRIGCTYHTAMRSWIYVFDHPWYQLTDASGTYRMTNVPPGEYRLEVAHPAGEMRMSRMIQVRAGETLQMDLTIGPDQRVSP
jgi:plastocyanin